LGEKHDGMIKGFVIVFRVWSRNETSKYIVRKWQGLRFCSWGPK